VKQQDRVKEPMPYRLRAGATIADTVMGTGNSRTVIYEKIRAGEIKVSKVGRRTIVDVPSALKAFGLAD
jgi:hypothetical protein